MSEGQIALITGGNRELGRSTALRVAEDGTDVILTYRSNADEASAVAAEITGTGRVAVAIQLDTSVVDGFAAFRTSVETELRERWDRTDFDFLVNNAGVAANGSIAETTVESFDMLYGVHLKGVYFLTQSLMPLIADGGRIINLSTGLARFTGQGWSAYAAMKGAIEVFTRYLAAELGPRGIRANTVAPGPIGTDFGGGMMRDNEQARAAMAGLSALGRIGEPDDIGGVIASLLAPGTGWITGQLIEASGGTLL
ncbi:SDR family oxidoreductase [Glaciihabitans sp. UYNi722]|uniref:SDR family NAD(P)-dependent oxidoreductase n=1 Tax=Glaciihabitans sp. UYNi722 TaxID=3156344 RepID=UPI003391B7FC